MNSNNSKNPLVKAVVQQVTNNATSWLGHHTFENKDVICGQTFVAPSEGELEAIEVFASIVTTPGNVVMTVHSFDPQLKSWGPVLGSANVSFNSVDTGTWKPFNIRGLHLNKGKTYGFRLESTDSYIGVGESVGSHERPISIGGQEWKFINKDQKGQSFSYFSLAFKVDVRA